MEVARLLGISREDPWRYQSNQSLAATLGHKEIGGLTQTLTRDTIDNSFCAVPRVFFCPISENWHRLCLRYIRAEIAINIQQYRWSAWVTSTITGSVRSTETTALARAVSRSLGSTDGRQSQRIFSTWHIHQSLHADGRATISQGCNQKFISGVFFSHPLRRFSSFPSPPFLPFCYLHSAAKWPLKSS